MSLRLVLLISCGFSFITAYYQFDNSETVSSCQCVPTHLCLDKNIAVTGNDFLDIRFEDDTCANYFEICCEMPIKPEKPALKPTKPCGLQMNSISTRITSNSEITEFGELPWTVLVLQRDFKNDRNAFICGGSLIHPQVVLTASHCVSVTDSGKITIRAGEWNIRSKEEALPHQDNIVSEVVIHPNYKPGTLWNDIALLFLKKPFDEADNIGYICLPQPVLKMDDNTNCIASGWGKNSFSKSRHSSVLRKVVLPLIPKDKCLTALRSTRLGHLFKLHRSFVCAGGEKNKDTCKGDGGSPLICPLPGHNGKFVQMGIVSWGIGCGGDGTPGVYVNLLLYSDWINKQLIMKNFDTSFYKY